MKIKNILIALAFFIVSILLSGIILLSNNTFYLDNEYYGGREVEEINTSELKKMMALSKSFALFVYQPACVNSANFELLLKQFQVENNISLKKIAFSNLKGTELENKIKYYPSFVIFKNGEVIDYLDADKAEDTEYFKNKDSFYEWFTKHVLIKQNKYVNTNPTTTEVRLEDQGIVVDLPEVKKDDEKVNIYLFWGDGCPHCKHEKEFFKSIEEKYGDFYNIYMFETWKNKENLEIMKVFAYEMGDSITGGVPYTIIGGKSFRGFNSSSEDAIKKAIISESGKDFDVYFDIIKDKYKGD